MHNPKNQKTYKVKSGEKLSDVAKKFKTTATHLAEINEIPRPFRIKNGQIINLSKDQALQNESVQILLKFVIFVLFVILAALLVRLYQLRVGEPLVDTIPEELSQPRTVNVISAPAENETPEPEVVPVIIPKSDFAIRILNGNGIRGEAGRVQNALQEKQFVIGETGNADNFSYQQTIIEYSIDYRAHAEEIEKTLQELGYNTQRAERPELNEVIVTLGQR